jgi:DNA-binding MarR family transcriptional regulator
VDERQDREAAITRIMSARRRMTHLFAFTMSDPMLTAHLTMPQFRVLLVLALRGAAAVHDLAEMMGVSLATITGIVDRLSAAELVTRREDPRDRRVRRIELTPSGQALVDGIAAAGTANQRRLLDRLSLDDLGILGQAFDLLADAAEAERTERASATRAKKSERTEDSRGPKEPNRPSGPRPNGPRPRWDKGETSTGNYAT